MTRVSNLKVLVVDDDDDMCRLLEMNLRLEGFKTGVAANGEEALEAIVEERPDIVLLDVMMPVLDGHDVLRRLNPAGPAPRVIFVTARAADEAQLQGWELGCDDYITKPFDLDDLIERIREVAGRSAAENEAHRLGRIADLMRVVRG